MKKKDLTLIIVVTIVSAVFSLVISSVFISTPKNRTAKVEVVQPITSNFPLPSSKYFNTDSVDPTQLITIGNNTNNQPFNGPKQ